MYFYDVCGLSVSSDFEIPYLYPAKANLDNCKSIKLSNKSISSKFFLSSRIQAKKNRIFYKNKKGFVFEITKNGIVIFSEKTPALNVIQSLMGIPMGYLLKLNDYHVLHGSSVSMSKKGICFIGSSGSGKSSIAMSLLLKGRTFLTEDLCILKNNLIYNFNQWIKASKNDLEASKIQFSQMHKISNDSRMRRLYKVPDNYVLEKKIKPKVAYFLKDSDQISIDKLDKKEAFKLFFTYSYHLDFDKTSDLNRISEVTYNFDTYVFQRDMKMPLALNIKYLEDHIKEAL